LKIQSRSQWVGFRILAVSQVEAEVRTGAGARGGRQPHWQDQEFGKHNSITRWTGVKKWTPTPSAGSRVREAQLQQEVDRGQEVDADNIGLRVEEYTASE
jgi:hypothetical protein